MRVLVTGAEGQLGRALLASRPDGWHCQGLGRSDLDLTDAEAIAVTIADLRPDLLVNAAAYTAVDRAEDDRDAAFAVNATAVGVLAQALARVDAKLVHVSTDFVFDGKRSRPYQPNDRLNPLSVYGESKARGEELAGDDALIVRTAWVHGGRRGDFVSTMLKLMSQRSELGVVADQIGAPTWAPRLAEVIWRLCVADRSGTYHYSDAGVASWYDFAVAIYEEACARGLLHSKVLVRPITSAQFPTRAVRPQFSLLDSSQTLRDAGLDPVHWRDALRCSLSVLAGEKAGEE